MSSFRILYFAKLSEILFKNALFISSLSSGKWLIPLVPFIFEKLILFNRERAHFVVMSIVPPFSFSSVLSLNTKIPIPPAMTTCALSTPPATLSLRMYALTGLLYCQSFKGRPRSECGETLSLFFTRTTLKKNFDATYRAFVYFSPQLLAQMTDSFCRTILNRLRGHFGSSLRSVCSVFTAFSSSEGDRFFHLSITNSDLSFLLAWLRNWGFDFPISSVLHSLISTYFYWITTKNVSFIHR